MAMFGSVIQQGKNTSTDQEKLGNPSFPQSNLSVQQVDFHCFWTMKEMCGLKETVQRAVWDLKTLYFKNIRQKFKTWVKLWKSATQTPFHCFWMKMELFGHAEKFLISIMPLWCASHARLKVFLQSEQFQQESVTRCSWTKREEFGVVAQTGYEPWDH